MRIRYDGDFLHESEHRSGGMLVVKMGKHVWFSMRNMLRGSTDEWAPSGEQQTGTYD